MLLSVIGGPGGCLPFIGSGRRGLDVDYKILGREFSGVPKSS
jgi:hypothetical protein